MFFKNHGAISDASKYGKVQYCLKVGKALL